jgi:hypothetical protein
LKQWASNCKRIGDDKPYGIGVDSGRHNLTKVLNQCANLERLIETLQRVSSPGTTLSTFTTVRVCHPTTSSGVGENDLVSVKPAISEEADFEISDVISELDSNRKELAELIALGVLSNNAKRNWGFASHLKTKPYVPC